MELKKLLQKSIESVVFDSPFLASLRQEPLPHVLRSRKQVNSYDRVLQDYRSVYEEFGYKVGITCGRHKTRNILVGDEYYVLEAVNQSTQT